MNDEHRRGAILQLAHAARSASVAAITILEAESLHDVFAAVRVIEDAHASLREAESHVRRITIEPKVGVTT